MVAWNNSSCVVIIFSMAELAWASCKLTVSINKVGLGRFFIAPFNSDKALLAKMIFLRITLVSISALGGRSGKLLYGFSGSYFIFRLLDEGLKRPRFLNEGKNREKTPSFKIRGQNLHSLETEV